MQRLVYSPKAYIFIKQRNGNIADVSRYCTAGQVQRRVSAVSTANFTLRNPNMLFSAKGGNHAAFFPMDPITIYLQRLHNRPVRVFTGFLDDTPYYELYPGVIEFSASCTLKRLLHTYFDPSLPYTQSFLAAYGWQPDGQGGLVNPQALAGLESEKDGGMGSLLFATLKEIGHWDDKNIKIEALPKGLLKRMSNMIAKFEDDNAHARAELELLIQRFVGAGDYGSSGSGTTTKYEGDVADIVYQVGKGMGVSTKFLLAAFETGIVESGMKNLDHGDADSKGWRQERVSIYGESATDVNASAKRFYNECKQFDKGDSQSAGELAADVQRPAAQYRGRYDEVRAEAVSLLEKTKARVDKKNAGKDDTANQKADDYKKAIRRDGRSNKNDTGKDAENRAKLSKSTDVRGALPGLEVMANLAAAYGVPISAGKTDHGTFTSTGNVSDHSRGLAIDVSNGTSPTPEMDALAKFIHDHLAPLVKQLIWRNKDQFNGYPIPDHMNHVHIAIKPEFAMNKDKTVSAVVDALAGRSIDVPDSSSNSSVDYGGDGMIPRINATALAIHLQWDVVSGQAESIALTGNKSLMNDKPLMPFVQQMVESSLRQFQSMPNGDFFAFYPDYFGETWHRPPYWIIDDIEVLDGRVRLSDAALVTHQYAIGNTSMGGDELTNRLMSAGSISIINAFQTELVTPDATKKKDDKNKDTAELYHAFNRALKHDEAVQFLERYGARPVVEDFPFIRNPFFEMFMAYQHFMQSWARQFISPFKLTFMPELYPGGKVGFPEHGLQMYVEEVTHSWDYESGFTTEADLSAPAVMVDQKGQPYNRNLPPNMPTALVEVAAAKTEITSGDIAHPSPLAPITYSDPVEPEDTVSQNRPT